MKKIRTLTQLSDALDQDLQERKRALTTLKFAVQRARKHERGIIGLSAVCVLYGHWEGFVKFAGKCYTNHVNQQGLTYGDLSNGIVSACLRSKVRGLRDTRKVSLHLDVVELLRDRGAEKAGVPWQAAIETYDNLSSEVLLEVLAIVGCPNTDYLTQRAFIDEKLLRHRNTIAHNGGSHEFDVESDYEDLHDGVMKLLNQFKDDVEKAATDHSYKRSQTG